jgi:hypothetical protein
MHRIPLPTVLFVVLLLLGPPSVCADDVPDFDDPVPAAAPASQESNLDVVELTGGKQKVGRVTVDNDDWVVLEVMGRSGGVMSVKMARKEVVRVRYGAGPATRKEFVEGRSSDLVRDEWYLIRSEARIIGTRRIRITRMKGDQGSWRLREDRHFFPQGKHVPGVLISRTEVTDADFALLRTLYREVSANSTIEGGPRGYARTVTGQIEDVLWKGKIKEGNELSDHETRVPVGAMGPLGLREKLLRTKPRRVAITEATVLDGEHGALSAVRAGFVALAKTDPATGVDKGAEFHWEVGGLRLVSRFGRAMEPLSEALAEGMDAIPCSEAQAQAAADNAEDQAKDPDHGRVRLPEAGIAFRLPGPDWTWAPTTARPVGRKWHLLGNVKTAQSTVQVRIEWHVEGAREARGLAAGRDWVVARLRSACPDLRVVDQIQMLPAIPEGWRMDVVGTLKGDTRLHTVVIVVDRGPARLLALIACPLSEWEMSSKAVGRLVDSFELL